MHCDLGDLLRETYFIYNVVVLLLKVIEFRLKLIDSFLLHANLKRRQRVLYSKNERSKDQDKAIMPTIETKCSHEISASSQYY